MVNALLALLRGLRSVWFVETAGAALVVGGIYEGLGLAAAIVAAGVALLLKSLDMEMRRTGDG